MIVFALVFRTLAMGMRVFVGPYERIDKEDDQKDGAACFKGVERGVAGTGCYRAVAESKPRGGEKIVDYKSEGYGGYYDGCNIKGGGACAEVLRRSITDAKLAAGPAMRSTNAAPGDRPLSISESAIGIDPVAQTYIGIAMATTASIANKGRSPRAARKFSGTNMVIRAAITRPIISHLPMLATMVWKP